MLNLDLKLFSFFSKTSPTWTHSEEKLLPEKKKQKKRKKHENTASIWKQIILKTTTKELCACVL